MNNLRQGRDVERISIQGEKKHLCVYTCLKMLQEFRNSLCLQTELLQAAGIRLQVAKRLHLTVDQMLVQIQCNVNEANRLMKDNQWKVMMVSELKHVLWHLRDVVAKLDT